MRGGLSVEVRKSAESSTWYNATVLDVIGDNIRVAFEDDVWPSREVPASLVRQCPPASADEAFTPKEKDVVEVAVAATEASPSGWSLGRVKKIKNKVFYFVTFEGAQRTTQDVIVEREGLRKVNDAQGIDPAALVRKLIPVDRGLHTWIRSQDSLGCLKDVATRTSLLAATCAAGRPDARGPPKVSLVGDERSVALAEKLLVEIHFKNQAKMQRFHEHREKLMEQIRQLEQQYSKQHREVFTVENGFIGRIIGTKGTNIIRIREELEVEVHIAEAKGGGKRDSTTITVTGPSAEAVSKAREQMEYVTAKVHIEPDQVGWIVGKGYQNLQDIQRKAELQYARYDDKSNSIEFCGLRSQVENAKLMVSVHRDYLAVYQDMSEERRTIQQQFAELDRTDKGYGKKGKGKSGKKGKGKGASQNGEAHDEAEGHWEDEDAGGEVAEATQQPEVGRGGGRGGAGRGVRKGAGGYARKGQAA